LHTILKWVAKYTDWLRALLLPLGAWGVFAIGAMDSAFIGMPLDAVVAYYVYQKPHLFWLYTLMAAAGSAIGSVVLYGIGYKGGEVLIERRFGKERFARIRDRFEKQEFLALMIPSMLPPLTPFKLIVLSAAVLEMRLPLFLLAIFAGRIARFLILSALVIKFGPQVITIAANLLKQHMAWTLAILAGLAVIGLLMWWRKRREFQRELDLS